MKKKRDKLNLFIKNIRYMHKEDNHDHNDQ